MSTSPRVKPSKAWYWVGSLVIVAGLVGAVVLAVAGVTRVDRTVDGFARFVAPGAASLTFERAGTFTVYYEWDGDIAGTALTGAEQPPGDLAIRVVDESAAEVPLAGSSTTAEYDIGGRAGTSIGTITIAGPGEYAVVAESSAPGPFGIAVGRSIAGVILRYVALALASAALGIVVGTTVLVVTGVTRSRRRAEWRRAHAAAAATPQAQVARPWAEGGPGPAATPSPWAPPAGPPSTGAPSIPTAPPAGGPTGPVVPTAAPEAAPSTPAVPTRASEAAPSTPAVPATAPEAAPPTPAPGAAAPPAAPPAPPAPPTEVPSDDTPA